jgi:pyrimidine operon attenuation protein / uracil phosphoribosyltransferase
MESQGQKLIVEASGIKEYLESIAGRIANEHPKLENVALVGLRTRGAHLAERLKNILFEISGVEIPTGIIDITLYRDDLTSIGPQPIVNKTIIPFNITAKKIILVDDVFYTGRTMRAALDEIMDFGRPSLVQIAVLIDRRRRELPIHPDYAGIILETAENETVQLYIDEVDGKEKVVVAEKT